MSARARGGVTEHREREDPTAETPSIPSAAQQPHPVHLVAAYGPTAGSARVRLHDWADHLGLPHVSHPYRGAARNSAGALLRSPISTARAERQLRRLPARLDGGTVVLSRAAGPFSHGGIEEAILRRAGRAAYDVDDAIMIPTDGLRGRLFPLPEVFARAAAAADVVIAGNAYLAERASEHAGDVRVIPSCVEPGDYLLPDDPVRDRAPRLVWIGSPSTESYLSQIAPAIVEACRRTSSELLVISAGEAQIPGLPEGIVRRIPWGPDTYARSLAQGDVGIMPLADSEWERGKCAYKLLQYGAAGLPVVGSPVGANFSVLEAMGAPAPRTLDEWTDALVQSLTGTPEERFADGRRARRVVEAAYSFEANAEAWRRAVGLPVGAGE